MGIIIALLSGALMSVQGVLNTAVTKQSSIWTAAGWVQISAFAVCVLMWMFGGRQPIGALWQVQPRYMLLGGILGALITYTVIRSVNSLGPAQSALLIVVAQIIIAYVIELFGLFGVEKAGFEWKKVIGALVAIGGIIIFKSSR
ncbi:MAG: DMT family transporter [Lachnospiraceae bacterium]|nr:DMT family transporter [Lachnospiraceae bacterium]